MKKILVIMIFSMTLLIGKDSVFVSILNNVSIPNVNSAIKNARLLQKDLNSKNFTEFLKSWKRVETLYFAGEIDDNYIDTPRYIDVFHNLKEDLIKQMKRVVSSNDEPNIALFKHSFKTINALEYVLFNDNKITSREKELSKVILKTIISKLEDIKEVYKIYVKKHDKSEQWENGIILNTLIASTYSLKEWRIGDPAGLTVKYKDDVNNQRAEYFLSKNSFNAIKAILEAHEQIIDDKPYKNFATLAEKGGAKEAIRNAQKSLKKVFKEINKISKIDDFSNVQSLYKAVSDLHNYYYVSLVEDLTISAKLLDADGD